MVPLRRRTVKGESCLTTGRSLRLTLALLTLVALPAAAADISGDWSFKVSSPEGEHSARLSVTQQGSKITGAFASDRGEHKVEGTVTGNEIHFTVRYTGGDQTMLIPFNGKLQGDKMAGEYKAGDTTGAWTAEKVK